MLIFDLDLMVKLYHGNWLGLVARILINVNTLCDLEADAAHLLCDPEEEASVRDQGDLGCQRSVDSSSS